MLLADKRVIIHYLVVSCGTKPDSRMKQQADKHNSRGDTSLLLGGCSGPYKDGDFIKWEPALAMVSATIDFATTTGGMDKETTPDKIEQKGHLADEEEESEEGEENEGRYPDKELRNNNK